MLQKFEQTMLKMSLLGFDQSALTDCSDVIPIATGTVKDPFIPAGLTVDDLQPACAATPFPTVDIVAGTCHVGRTICGSHLLTTGVSRCCHLDSCRVSFFLLMYYRDCCLNTYLFIGLWILERLERRPSLIMDFGLNE